MRPFLVAARNAGKEVKGLSEREATAMDRGEGGTTLGDMWGPA